MALLPNEYIYYLLAYVVTEETFSKSVQDLVAQSCPTLCDPMDHSPPGSSVNGDSPGKNTGVGCHALLQGICPTLGLNPGLPHCRQIIYHLSHQGSPSFRLPRFTRFTRFTRLLTAAS